MAHTPIVKSSLYLEELLNTDMLKHYAERSEEILRNLDFQAIAFRGMSGALIAPFVAVLTGKSLIMVRKQLSHSAHMVEGDSAATRYVIVDDFIDSGTTVAEIISEIGAFSPDARCIGVLEVSMPYKYVDNAPLTDPRQYIPIHLHDLVDHPGVYPCV